jgi:hypothetical protein
MPPGTWRWSSTLSFSDSRVPPPVIRDRAAGSRRQAAGSGERGQNRGRACRCPGRLDGSALRLMRPGQTARTSTRASSRTRPRAAAPTPPRHPERDPERQRGGAEGSAPTERAPSLRQIPRRFAPRDDMLCGCSTLRLRAFAPSRLRVVSGIGRLGGPIGWVVGSSPRCVSAPLRLCVDRAGGRLGASGGQGGSAPPSCAFAPSRLCVLSPWTRGPAGGQPRRPG